MPRVRDTKAEYARRKERAALAGTTPARLRVRIGMAKGQTKAEARGHGPKKTGERHYRRLTHLSAKASAEHPRIVWNLEQWIAGPFPFTYGPKSRVQRIRIKEAAAAVEKFTSKQVRIAVYGEHLSRQDELDWKTFVTAKSDVVETLKQAQAELDGYMAAHYQTLLQGGIRPGRAYGPLTKRDAALLRSVERRKEEEIMQRVSTEYMKFHAEYLSVFAWAVSEAK